MNCTVPGCKGTAVLQWQRAASAGEHEAFATDLRDGIAAVVESQRDSAALAAEQLRAAGERQPPTLDGDRRRRRAFEQADRMLTDVPDVPTFEVPPVSSVAVFGCDKHKIDLDAATVLHGVSCCTTSEGCRCGGSTTGGKA